MPRAVEITTWQCRVPLEHPLHFKSTTITHRDCTVVRVSTDDGLTGAALGLNRGAPLDAVIQDMLAPSVLDHDALDADGFQHRARSRHAFVDQTGMLAQARSLVDLALWDIRGKHFGAPLWRLLGGGRETAPVSLVEGYELPGESDADFAARLLARVDEGYRSIKVEAAGYENPRQLLDRLHLVREARDATELALVVDVNGSWPTLRHAQRMLRDLEEFDLAWLEDPFPHHRFELLRPLTENSAVPIGSGDDITDPQILIDLVTSRAVDVLRVDATTLGGMQDTLDVLGAARQAGIPTSGHAHSYVHQHLSFASEAMHHIEVFPDDRPFEPSYRLTTGSVYPHIQDGLLHRPAEPGLAFTLDLDRIEQWADRSTTRRAA
ncbi:L-alanine-DL-glutamate epimerase-like enolase superfamily enzyme [Pseudoclavibacter sp. JAI123]|uniref:mandelate racemase/muconate lactonizing enzyme family protein n=1 Tax=Pseudoclavibacter sp. JAI123 TaxID=2723065 RepID=UPI0015C8943F|nr:mandelate racemase/muconate lactonizing enzyme family protein [Pseudoclavibacter sp. JAI123]NYF15136.1 L-alanine-DL-glutamate epimerase-like enolase superfamily enzyme [Pseudoclavibacter sp. JAI123]